MEIEKSSDGSFEIHSITGRFEGKCSTYFDSKGELIEATQFFNSGSFLKLRPLSRIWNICARYKKMVVR
jgi:hypothetical protein